MTQQSIADFQGGQCDVAESWIDVGPCNAHIRYQPCGAYLGNFETVQD